MTERFPHEWPVSVAITMNDGTVHEGRVDEVKWSPRRPPSWDDIAEKFVTLGAPVIGSTAHRVVEEVARYRIAGHDCAADGIRIASARLTHRRLANE